jgi:hypothetical protein
MIAVRSTPPMVEHIDITGRLRCPQSEDQHLAADAFEADRTGELLVGDGAHDAGDVVRHDEDDECDQKAVTAAQEPAEPASDGGECELNGVPEFFHALSSISF